LLKAGSFKEENSMPTRKHVARDEQHEPEAATAGAASEPATDGPQVLWRKEASQATATVEEGSADEAVDWKSRYQEEQARADDLFAKLQRAAADMANMRRRHEQDRQEYVKRANEELIRSVLPVLDSFDLALAAIPEDLEDRTWVDGIVLVERQLRGVLERAGVSPIEAGGKVFDPNEHEAVMNEASDQPEGTVTGELQRGYKLHDRVIRPAMVKVATNS
jgi:molecular chaperone GrpE